METRRFLNSAQPRSLYYAQFALYAGAVYPVLQAVLTNRPLPWVVVLALLTAVAAYGLSNEGRWAYWFGTIVSAITLVKVIYDIVQAPSSILHPDVWVLIALPVAAIWLLTNPASRDFVRVWYH